MLVAIGLVVFALQVRDAKLAGLRSVGGLAACVKHSAIKTIYMIIT